MEIFKHKKSRGAFIEGKSSNFHFFVITLKKVSKVSLKNHCDIVVPCYLNKCLKILCYVLVFTKIKKNMRFLPLPADEQTFSGCSQKSSLLNADNS